MEERTCVRCGWRFTPNELAPGDYCSPACTNAAKLRRRYHPDEQVMPRPSCVVCGLEVPIGRRKMCGDECARIRFGEQTRAGAARRLPAGWGWSLNVR